MDYSQLSDFEINVAVFEAIHNGSPDYKEGENGDTRVLLLRRRLVDLVRQLQAINWLRSRRHSVSLG